MLKLGILGAGFMGGTHAAAFAALPDVQIVGISSRSPEKAKALAEKYGAEAFDDPFALATDPRVDAISNTLPTHVHRDTTIAALRAGKHVLVEKPMALSVADCDAMIAAALESNRTLMVAQVLRFWPEYVALADFVATGRLGKPLAGKARRLAGPPRWADFFLHPEEYGGGVVDLQVHDLDALNWLFGQPVSVYSRGQKSPESGGWDLALTTVDYGGVAGFAEGSTMQAPEYPFTMSLEVTCELGSVEFNFRAGGVQVDSRDEAGTSLNVYEKGKGAWRLEAETVDAYHRQAAAFVDVACGTRPLTMGTPEQGRLAVATVLAARQSLETGQVVYL